MGLKKDKEKKMKNTEIKVFIKKLVLVIISSFIVLMFIVGNSGFMAYAPVLLGIYTIMIVLFWMKFRKHLWMLVLLTILMFAIPSIWTSYKVKTFSTYTAKNNKEKLNSFLDDSIFKHYEACFSQYEKAMLGIKNNTALSGISISCDANKTYENKIKDMMISRNPDNQMLEIKENGQVQTLTNTKVGEIIATTERIFYIDTDQNNILCSMDLDSKKMEIVSESHVDKFAVLGNYIIFLTSDGKLKRFDLKNKTDIPLAENIQKFYIGKDIIAQNSTQIVSISYDGKKTKKLKGNAILKGYNDGIVYFMPFTSKNNNKFLLYQLDIETLEESSVEKSNKYIKSVYVVNGKNVIDTVGN